ncbi:MAG: hypothetical protein QOE58_2680 [Actinomycetota bacterium]|nr:hypothetical protein [Actinomycetota bacterium]
MARSLIEYLLPSSAWEPDIDKVVFVGATNAGTHLADPDNWDSFVDLHTNLAAATARSIEAKAGPAQASEMLEGMLTGIGVLIKYLVMDILTKRQVPGIAAMDPDGPFITGINGTQPGQPVAATTPWHVVSSDFEPKIPDGADDTHEPIELPRELALKTADGLADRLIGDKNDLVVDTASMSAVDLPSGGGFIKESLVLGTNSVVYHLNYFIQPNVCEALRHWLT